MDDIVTRLRQECGCQWIPWNEVPCKPCRAADEIERLRAAGDDLAYWLRAETVNGSMALCEGTNEALDAWEARRG